MSNRPRQLPKINSAASICASFEAFREVRNFRHNTAHPCHHWLPLDRHGGGGGESSGRAITASRRRSSVEPVLWKWSRPPHTDLSVPLPPTYQYRARAEHNTADAALRKHLPKPRENLLLCSSHVEKIIFTRWTHITDTTKS